MKRTWSDMSIGAVESTSKIMKVVTHFVVVVVVKNCIE